MADDQNQILTALAQMMTKVDQRFDQITAHVDETHNDAMTKMDAVYKEVLDMRQEQAMHTGAHQRVDETIDEHDRRIKRLESPTSVAHSIQK